MSRLDEKKVTFDRQTLLMLRKSKYIRYFDHCQIKVPNLSRKFFDKKGGKFKLSVHEKDLSPFVGVGNGTKVKIPSDIKQPLNVVKKVSKLGNVVCERPLTSTLVVTPPPILPLVLPPVAQSPAILRMTVLLDILRK